MRISLRRAAKIAAVVLVIIITNFLICYEVSGNIGKRQVKRGDGQIADRTNDNGRFSQVPADTRHEFGKNQLSDLLPKRIDNNPTLVHTNISIANSFNRETELSDIFISVKTTGTYHQTRLKVLMDTWILLARDQTHIFTDKDDKELSEATGVDIINTGCFPAHTRQALCCKMAVEYDTFLASKKRWFCHVDDDNYINIPQLVKLLRKYNHTQDWYLGKPSLKRPIEMVDRKHREQRIAFWFATGGAGICISRGLALKMMPHASGGRIRTVGENIRLPDDCTIGYIISHLLKKDLTVIDEFHSHLESLNLLKKKDLRKQITFSYKEADLHNKENILNIPGFNKFQDPSRLRSLHCYLFPTFRECRGINS